MSDEKINEKVIGIVKSINISEKKGTVKNSVDEGQLIENFGFKGDAHAGKWHRQVSLLAQESIDKMKNLEIKGLCSGTFAENITTEGIEIHKLEIGTKISVGEGVLEITQIGKECHDGCEIKKTVGQCIMPKEGIFAKVIKGGRVKKGDMISIVYD